LAGGRACITWAKRRGRNGFVRRGTGDEIDGATSCVFGDQFLGIDRLIGGDEVAAEAGDFVEVFESNDG
jgi:hypothetical protein